MPQLGGGVRAVFLLVGLGICLGLLVLSTHSTAAGASGAGVLGWLAPGSFHRARFPGLTNPRPALNARSQSVCDLCTCDKLRDSEWWMWRPYLPNSLRPSGPALSSADLGLYVHAAILEAICPHIHVRDPAVAVNLLKARPAETMAWDLAALVPMLPTCFAFTKTASFGGKLTPEIRAAYFDRHVQTILRHREIVERQGYFDGVPADGRQVVWIIVEDNDRLDQNIVRLLRNAGISFIYFAFGPTRSWGNAQHNAALTVMHALTDPDRAVLGHGPIFSMDDDAEIHEDLFDWVWRIKRIGVWPMGNLGPTGFEGPTWDEEGKNIVEWDVRDDPTRTRLYPIDNGAFAINSSLLGNGIEGPAFWPEDTNGGESEFLDTFLSGRQDLERVCGPCHVAWHNQPIEISTLWLNNIPYPF